MSDKPVVFDDDNPEWTEADFARAKPPTALPPHMLSAFPKTRAVDRDSDRRRSIDALVAGQRMGARLIQLAA